MTDGGGRNLDKEVDLVGRGIDEQKITLIGVGNTVDRRTLGG